MGSPPLCVWSRGVFILGSEIRTVTDIGGVEGDWCLATERGFIMWWVALTLLVTVLRVDCVQHWEEEPGYKEVNPGGEVIMVCRVRNKQGECRWERDNTPIAAFPGKYQWAGDRKQGDCSLKILSANIEYDNGGWVCQVTASSFRERDTLISQPASLVVRAPPTSVHLVVQPSRENVGDNLVAIVGQKLGLECRAEGGNPPPALRWRIGKRVMEGAVEDIHTDTGVTVSTLELKVNKKDQDKIISCEVIHPALQGELKHKAIMDVQYAPEVSISSIQSYYVEGDPVTITCTSEASPSASVLWYRAQSGQIITRQPELRLEAVTKEQAGEYVCRANNTVGTSEPATAKLNVQYGPSILSVGPALHLDKLIRSKLELVCDASGNPEPAYTWLQHTEEGVVVRGEGRLFVIDNVEYDDQGKYQCRASNTIRGNKRTSTSHMINLNVTGAPKVRESWSELSVIRGTDALVSVEFCADPMSKQSWQLGGLEGGQSRIILSPQTQHERYSVLAEETAARADCYLSTLKIGATKLEDTREYVLHLENPLGLETHTVQVTVREALQPLTLIAAIAGGVATLVILVLVFCCCRKPPCRGEKHLKQDMERSV